MTAADAVQENLVEFFRHFARVRGTGQTEELDGVSIAASGIAFHMFNAAFLSAPVTGGEEDLACRIDLAATRLGSGGGRWAFWACEERLRECISFKASRVFRRRGLTPALRHPGMVSERLAPARRRLPDLEIRPVQDRPSRAVFAHINAVAFHIPYEWCLQLYDLEALWGGAFVGHVGYSGGEPVSTVATLAAAGAIGIYAVATLPAYEHRGFAEAMTRYGLALAQEQSGIRRSILQATSAGLPLYHRMGYDVVTHFTVFSA
ncbi:MAG: GNAT family N-acetyltransferase [Bryobacteraceae bacterium]